MRQIFPFLIIVFTLPVHAQIMVSYSFEDISKNSEITNLYINSNIIEVVEIPSQISQLTSLKELVIFPRDEELDFDKGETHGDDESEIPANGISKIPAEITKCQNLEVLKIPRGTIDALPEGFEELPKLRILRLPNGSNLDVMQEQLRKIRTLELLICIFCQFSEENRGGFNWVNPHIAFIVSEDELIDVPRQRELFAVNVGDKQQIMFLRKSEAKAYVQSFPAEVREKYKISLARN